MSAEPGSARPRTLAQLTLHTFVNLILGTCAQVAAGIAVARVLGPSGKGLVSYAGYVLALALTSAEGLRNAIAFEVGTRGLPRPAVWAAALRIVAVLALGGVAILVALARIDAVHTVAFAFVAIAVPFALYLQIVNMIYQLAHRLEAINFKNTLTIGTGAPLATLVAVAFFHVDVTTVLAIWAAGYVAAALWSTAGLRGMLGGPARLTQPELIREQAAFGAKASLAATVAFLALRVDVFIVAALLAPAALGVYTLAVASGELMWLGSRSLLWSSSGTVATVDAPESATLTARLVRVVLAVELALAVPAFIFGPWLIDLVYGSAFHASGMLLRILLPGLVLYGVDGVISYYIAVRAARPGLLLGVETVTFALCAGLTYFGVVRFGLAGAAVADTVTYAVAIAVKGGLFCRAAQISPLELLRPRRDDIAAFTLVRRGQESS